MSMVVSVKQAQYQRNLSFLKKYRDFSWLFDANN
tara:strand:+ start:6990 stop:7091 length:102 start_codon:yes stop_codon:yes gene_type:complete